MEKVVEKFHALQLFTDTFIAETVHLSNKQVGIYIRLLCFAWTKNAKAFNTTDAYTICQCRDESCEREVFDILEEFFILISILFECSSILKIFSLTLSFKGLVFKFLGK